MKKRVRVYIEGGAEGRTADSDFRRGWKKFLTELHETARNNGYHSLEVVRGKCRGNAFHLFKTHMKNCPDDLCVLLADSETEVPEGTCVWDTVAQRDGDKWQRPHWASERHLFLMVVFIETWLLTDPEALQAYFKRNFDARPLPTTNLEQRSKDDVERALKKATENCRNGPYRHGQAHEIIENVRPEKVKTLRHGLRLFEELGNLIRNQSAT